MVVAVEDEETGLPTGGEAGRPTMTATLAAALRKGAGVVSVMIVTDPTGIQKPTVGAILFVMIVILLRDQISFDRSSSSDPRCQQSLSQQPKRYPPHLSHRQRQHSAPYQIVVQRQLITLPLPLLERYHQLGQRL